MNTPMAHRINKQFTGTQNHCISRVTAKLTINSDRGGRRPLSDSGIDRTTTNDKRQKLTTLSIDMCVVRVCTALYLRDGRKKQTNEYNIFVRRP